MPVSRSPFSVARAPSSRWSDPFSWHSVWVQVSTDRSDPIGLDPLAAQECDARLERWCSACIGLAALYGAHASPRPLQRPPRRAKSCHDRDAHAHSCACGRSVMRDLAKEPEVARQALETMWTARRFEEAVDQLFARGSDARHDAPVDRSGGQRDGHVPRAAAGRPDHLDTPGAQPLRREGRRPDADDGRAVGQGQRVLPRPGRLDAHRRRRHRQPRRERHRRRRDPDRRGRRAGRSS